MAVLQRNDGIRFAVRSYRESITPKKTSLLRKELFLLSQTHGHYARFYKQRDGRIEAVFSRDSGYLLGETVWHHFGSPADLIYCEALPEQREVILVVVRAGSIYVDAKLTFEELAEELQVLFSSNARYAIYLVGDVPFSQQQDNDNFYIQPEWIGTFEHLQQSVFDELPLLSAFQLLPFEQALDELKLDASLKNILMAIGILFLLLGVWYWLSPAPQEGEQVVAVSPYEQYAAAYRNPEPAQQLNELAKQVVLLQSLPGWLPVSIDYISAGSKVKVHTLGSPTGLLLEWAEKNGGRVDFNTQGATLLLPSGLEHRNNIPPLTSLIKSLSTIIDRMMQIIPGKSVTITGTPQQAAYKATTITIHFNQGSAVVLALIGNALQGLPVVLTSSVITIHNGLLSGTIQLTVLGN